MGTNGTEILENQNIAETFQPKNEEKVSVSRKVFIFPEIPKNSVPFVAEHFLIFHRKESVLNLVAKNTV